MPFNIYAKGKLIGWSALESGDPPMGVASGVFHPNEAYEEIAPLFQLHFSVAAEGGKELASLQQKLAELGLDVNSEDGESVQGVGGVHITDARAELPDEPLQVEVLGVDSEAYQRFFPRQAAAYFGNE